MSRNRLTERIRQVAESRGWRRLRLLSSANNNYNRDYHGENSDGGQVPMLNVFARRNGKIYHTYATELQFLPPEKGQNQRHIDMMWPLWNLLDLTPEGRGTNWYPSVTYSMPNSTSRAHISWRNACREKVRHSSAECFRPWNLQMPLIGIFVRDLADDGQHGSAGTFS